MGNRSIVSAIAFMLWLAPAMAQSGTSSAQSGGDSITIPKPHLTHMQRDSSQSAKIDSLFLNDSSLTLKQNYPNPFQTTTTIIFQVNDPALAGTQVTLEVFDLSGTKLITLYDAAADNALHYMPFDGGGLPRGNYEYRLMCDVHEKVKLMNYYP